jgi:hypothetical protein
VSRITSSLLCGLSISLAACGGGQHASEKLEVDITETDSESDTDVSVQVISHAFRDATIYLYVGSSKHRLGIATGKRTTVFNIPWGRLAHAAGMRLAAHPIGEHSADGSSFATRPLEVGSDAFTVKPGNMVVWTLQSQLGTYDGVEAPGQSNVMVY